jgi:hypothetical protein
MAEDINQFTDEFIMKSRTNIAMSDNIEYLRKVAELFLDGMLEFRVLAEKASNNTDAALAITRDALEQTRRVLDSVNGYLRKIGPQ